MRPGARRGDAGSAARFYKPTGIVRVGATLFIADSGNHLIRRVALGAGGADDDDLLNGVEPGGVVVTTLAGGGSATGTTAGFADGAARAALFFTPRALAAADGVIYVADYDNYRIRAVDAATGAVATLAGSASYLVPSDGIGSAAVFGKPSGVAADGAGALYVAETTGCSIRRVLIATGAVSTVAGAGCSSPRDASGVGTAAHFKEATGIVAVSGVLFFTDRSSRVHRLAAPSPSASASTHATRTATATASASQLTPPSPTMLALPPPALVSIFVGGGRAALAGFADGVGTATALFSAPAGVAVAAGVAYVADSANHAIRAVELASSAVRTFAGRSEAGFADGVGSAALLWSPEGLAVDARRQARTTRGKVRAPRRRLDAGARAGHSVRVRRALSKLKLLLSCRILLIFFGDAEKRARRRSPLPRAAHLCRPLRRENAGSGAGAEHEHEARHWSARAAGECAGRQG
jgi:hypothetical protein